jgi:hypothetical protein
LNTRNVKEELYKSGIGKSNNLLIYKKDGNNIESSEVIPNEINKAISKLLKSNPYSSVLSLNNKFPILTNEGIKNTFKWFKEKLEIIQLNTSMPSLINEMSRNEKLLDFANNIFQEIGLGVKSLEIKSDNVNELLNSDSKEFSIVKRMIENKL